MEREAALERMAGAPLDLVVVGGGITGCGVARDAALRGLSVALLEKEDFGAGTSSRSSKIIHGGVRYLEQRHFLLVRESARERGVLKAIAPHLVHRIPFHYPVFGDESYWKVRAGLTLFDFLAGSRGSDRSRGLDPTQTRQAIPGLREPLKGAVRYPEYITDDARFTLENALSAMDHGALVANHARVVELLESNGRIRGVSVEDGIGGETREVLARAVVNATGPWVALFMEGPGLGTRKEILASKGIHILLPANRLPIEGATFLRSPTGRRGLAMRRGDWVYVGTSDDPYHGDLDKVRATRDEVEELLEMTRSCFPDAALRSDHVEASWAGLRPLILEEGKSTRDMSREDEVWVDPPGLVTVAGGKLTTYRRMAERVLRGAEETMGAPLPPGGATCRVPLPGCPGAPEEEGTAPLHLLEKEGVPPEVLERVGWLYGSQIHRLLEFGTEDPSWLRPLGSGVPALRGEVRLAVEDEMARTLVDFMDRRSALLLFAPSHGLRGAEEAARIMAGLLGWSDERREAELLQYRTFAEGHGLPSPLTGEGRSG